MSRSEFLAERRKKLAGTVLLVLFLFVYAVLAAFAAAILQGVDNRWIEAAYYAAAGLLWTFPAGLLIRWMLTPPRPAGRGADRVHTEDWHVEPRP